jgi:hypothetical protein
LGKSFGTLELVMIGLAGNEASLPLGLRGSVGEKDWFGACIFALDIEVADDWPARFGVIRARFGWS